MSISDKLNKNKQGFTGPADISYHYLIQSIRNDKHMSKKRKAELTNEITYLVGHIFSEVFNELTSADSVIDTEIRVSCRLSQFRLSASEFDLINEWNKNA